MKNLFIVAALVVSLFNNSFAQELKVKKFIDLPETFNSPASVDMDRSNNIYFTSPNFHNDLLIKQGFMKKAVAPTIGKIDNNNNLTTWYTFKKEDMDKKSGKIAPFGIAFGPNGNAYVADMQLWFGGESRILRINVKDGKAIGVDTVATGLSFPNAIVFKGDDMFVSDTVLRHEKGKETISAVYKININKLNSKKPLNVDASYIFEIFHSNGTLGFGANGLTLDGQGNLYTGLMEDGSVVKTTMDKNNNAIQTTLFSDGMIATDGFKWDKRTNKIYMTDLFANAIYSIDMNGKKELLAKNGNTKGKNGELDGPSELIIKGNDVIIMNFDAAFNDPRMVNKTPDEVHNLSIIKLK